MGAHAVRLSNIDIDNALDNRDFEVLFQPIFDLGNGTLSRMETFVRWQHPSLGTLPPGAFISFFESQGRMNELSRYILEEALRTYLQWRGNNGPGFSINLAHTDLSDTSFAQHLQVLLKEHKFLADCLTLECPMPPVSVEVETAMAQFTALRQTGVRLAIEVRGRANEFLRTASPFPFDEIKTGGAAILRFARTVRGPGLSAISELLDIATDASASITAVGVEDQASLSALRGLGFSAAQGNHLGKVGPLSDFRPGMVNSVRKLLDLDDLSPTEIQNFFNTKSQTSEQVHQQTGKPVQAENTITAKKSTIKSEKAKAETTPSNTKTHDNKENAHKTDAKALASMTTAERARRKAAQLARKKGSDVMRAEIAARRAKLGLSVPDSEKVKSVPAARGLQERLSSEYQGSLDVDMDNAAETVLPARQGETASDKPADITTPEDIKNASTNELSQDHHQAEDEEIILPDNVLAKKVTKEGETKSTLKTIDIETSEIEAVSDVEDVIEPNSTEPDNLDQEIAAKADLNEIEAEIKTDIQTEAEEEPALSKNSDNKSDVSEPVSELPFTQDDKEEADAPSTPTPNTNKISLKVKEAGAYFISTMIIDTPTPTSEPISNSVSTSKSQSPQPETEVTDDARSTLSAKEIADNQYAADNLFLFSVEDGKIEQENVQPLSNQDQPEDISGAASSHSINLTPITTSIDTSIPAQTVHSSIHEETDLTDDDRLTDTYNSVENETAIGENEDFQRHKL